MQISAPDLFAYPRYRSDLKPAPFLPMSRREMDRLGWDRCDVIIVTGDAYIDHPSFGMAVVGRFLEAHGFRVGIISQPDWTSAEPFKALGQPNLFFAVTAGNMDSMINRYTADRRMRHDDAYTPGGKGGKRPDRAVTVYSQRCKEAYKDVPIILGGIEASLRRIAQYDYWSDQVRRSVLMDATADMLFYGNAERALAELAHNLAQGRTIEELDQIRGTVVLKKEVPEGWTEIDSTRIDWPGYIEALPNPYAYEQQYAPVDPEAPQRVRIIPAPLAGKEKLDSTTTYIRLPAFKKVSTDPALYAHCSRVLHLESNPHNARVLVQQHDNREVWVNPPPIPLTTAELDAVFDLDYRRVPHPSYGQTKIPAYEMIRFSINIMRGCFGGCTFCSITEHEGRVIQSRSHESVLKEIEAIRDQVPGFTGTISDLGGPTANMYHLNCKSAEIQSQCRRLSCVYPDICKNLNTDHAPTTELYRKARQLPGVNKVFVASGLRYDLAVEDPEYVRELVTHHVGGYLKIAPEHTEQKTLDLMMKPGMGTYDAFKTMFETFSREAGKAQYLIPYFIAAHPGSDAEEMINLARWLKANDFKVDQVQTFYPSPMSLATAMYHSGRNPLKKVSYKSEKLFIPKAMDERKLQKAILRYHDPENWPLLRDTLKELGHPELIGDGPQQLIPAAAAAEQRSGRRRNPPKGATATGRDKPAKPSGKARSGNSKTGRKAPPRGTHPKSAPSSGKHRAHGKKTGHSNPRRTPGY